MESREMLKINVLYTHPHTLSHTHIFSHKISKPRTFYSIDLRYVLLGFLSSVSIIAFLLRSSTFTRKISNNETHKRKRERTKKRKELYFRFSDDTTTTKERKFLIYSQSMCNFIFQQNPNQYCSVVG
jgi:hypothetical protein